MLGQFSKFYALMLIALSLFLAGPMLAQDVGGDGGDGDNGDGDGGGAQLGGVEINAGELVGRAIVKNSRELNQQRFVAAQRSLNKDLQQTSEFRKVSITRLEREVQKLIDAGKPIPPEMEYLAGLTRITHVFFYPETNDIVVAGPAEGFFRSANNYVVGMQTGRATLKLQDLVVALRAYGPSGNSPSLISCSIDPTQEGLLKFKQTYTNIAQSGQFRRGMEAQVVKAYCDSLGMQEITVGGVSPKTDFARVMVEADYQMKLAGIGLKRVPGVTSFIANATPQSGNSMQRWFFQPDYDSVAVNQDRTAMKLSGNGVKLVGEDERLVQGQRQNTGGTSKASRIFCSTFTKAYPTLAGQQPIWGELRNVIDMSLVAAFIQKMDLYEKANWDMAVFGDENAYSVEKFEAATQVAPIANAVWKGRYFMAPLAGGVSIQPRVAFNSDRLKIDEQGQIDEVREGVSLDELEDGQWWWD